ncbi:MAG: hypothetical protein R3B47_10140 [Bacteroidia bacterium]
MKSHFLLILLPVMVLFACNKQESQSTDNAPFITASNPVDFAQKDAVISLNINDLKQKYPDLETGK